MPDPYVTAQNDVLDAICKRVYGVSDGATEQVLAANPFLAQYPLRLPRGLTLIMPELSKPQQRKIKIWD